MGFIINIVCVKCGQITGTLSSWGKHYYYIMPDGSLFEIYPERGWCWQCGHITEVQEGLSKSRIENGTGGRRRFTTEERAALLSFTKDRTSMNQCLKCLNFVADEDFFIWRTDAKTAGSTHLRHPGCGGILLKADSGMHLSFDEQDIAIEPLWAAKQIVM